MSVADGQGQCRARRFGLQYEPVPSLLLEYEAPNGKRRVRVVKLAVTSDDADVDQLTKKVIRSFPSHMDLATVKFEQVRKLVVRLVQQMRPKDVTTPRSPSSANHSLAQGLGYIERTRTVGPGSPKTPGRQGQQEGTFARHPDDAHMALYASSDSRFTTSSATVNSPRSAVTTPTPSPRRVAGGAAASSAAPLAKRPLVLPTLSRDDEDEALVLDAAPPEDLNRVSPMELQLAKQQMDQTFLKNQLRPGDLDYAYDKQIEFGSPTQRNEWDSEDD